MLDRDTAPRKRPSTRLSGTTPKTYHTNTKTRLQKYSHTTANTQPHRQKHNHTTTKTQPRHHKNTATPPQKQKTPPHHHKNTTTPYKNTTTPTQTHNHKNTTPAPQTHNHTDTKTPPQRQPHHHKNTTTPPQKHNHTTTKTQPQKHSQPHHRKNTTTPPQKRNRKKTKTQPQKHNRTTTKTQSQKDKNTTAKTQPHHHKNKTTPPQKHNHKNTRIWTLPQFWASDTHEVRKRSLGDVRNVQVTTGLSVQHARSDEKVAHPAQGFAFYHSFERPTRAKWRNRRSASPRICTLPQFWTSTHARSDGRVARRSILHLFFPQFWAFDQHEVTRGLSNPQVPPLRAGQKKNRLQDFLRGFSFAVFSAVFSLVFEDTNDFQQSFL